LPDGTSLEGWLDEKGRGVLFVVDECHEAFPKVTLSDKSYFDLETYFARHRHAGVDIIGITQSLAKINNNIRQLAQFTFRCKKAVLFGLKKWYIKWVFDGADSRSSLFNWSIQRYDKRVFKLYQNYTVGGALTAEANAKIKSIWSRGIFKIFVVVVLISAYQWYHVYQQGGIIPMPKEAAKRPLETAAPPGPSSSGDPVKPRGDAAKVEPVKKADPVIDDREPWEMLVADAKPTDWTIVYAKIGSSATYRFQVLNKSTVMQFDDALLRGMGVSLPPQGPCAVVLRGKIKSLFVGCRLGGKGDDESDPTMKAAASSSDVVPRLMRAYISGAATL